MKCEVLLLPFLHRKLSIMVHTKNIGTTTTFGIVHLTGETGNVILLTILTVQ